MNKKILYTGKIDFFETKIPCYVLDDGRRIFSNNGIRKLIKKITANDTGIKNQYIKQLGQLVPINCYRGQKKINGCEAIFILKICEEILDARQTNTLAPNKQNIAKQCEVIITSLARMGMKALADEAGKSSSYNIN